jgi:hypothetical protein
MRIVQLSSHDSDHVSSDNYHSESERQRADALPKSESMGPRSATAPSWRRPTSQRRDALGARRAKEILRLEDLRSVAPSDAQATATARRMGEQYTASELAEELGAEWTLMRGYRNSGGEIPQLLLGPTGLVAFSSLYLNATVHCRGDTWRADRFDMNEQFLGQMSLDDKAGRSPSARLNQPAEVLEELLLSSGTPIGVLRAVLLNHPRSRRGNCRRPTVEIFTSTFDFLTWMRSLPQMLDRADREQIAGLIASGQRGR